MGTTELSATRLRNKKRRQGRIGRINPRTSNELGGNVLNYRISDDEYDATKEWVRAYINKYCIIRNTPMPGKLPGSTYTWIFYLRKGLFNTDFMVAIAKMFVYKFERIDPAFNFQLTGLETAATPMLVGIPLVAKMYGIDLNAFVVRKKRKEYGLLNMFEGRPNQKVAVILDDLCNSGNSMSQCERALDTEGMEVARVAFTIVNKSNGSVHSATRQRTDMNLPQDIEVVSLFTLDDFGLANPSH